MPLENLNLARRVMIETFYFPIKKPNFNKQWNCFTNQINWKPTQNCVLCELISKDTSSIAPRYVI